MRLGVTGHRPPKLGGYRVPNPVYDAVCLGIEEFLTRLQPSRVLTGMALGVDQWTAEICLRLGMSYEAVLPFHGFSSKWPDQSKRQFEYLCSRAIQVHVVTNTNEYRPGLLMRRNEWVVRNSDAMLAVSTGSEGGTASTLRYAGNVGKRVNYVTLSPDILRMAVETEEQLESRRAFRQARPVANPYLMTILEPPPATNIEETVGMDMARQFWIPVTGHFAVPPEMIRESTIRTPPVRTLREEIEASILGPTSAPFIPLSFQVTNPTETPTSPEPQKEQTRALADFKPGRLIDLDE
jgi:uncharacterized phage-like protein YoqJ